MGPDFSVSVYLSLILYPHLKAAAPCQKPPFHVVAVDQQTRGSKMLINLTGCAAMLCALIWNSDWWIGALRDSQGETDSTNLEPSSEAVPHLIASLTVNPLHVYTWHFIFFCSSWRAMSGFASEAKQSGNSLDQRMNQTTGLIQQCQRRVNLLCSSTQTALWLNKWSIHKF